MNDDSTFLTFLRINICSIMFHGNEGQRQRPSSSPSLFLCPPPLFIFSMFLEFKFRVSRFPREIQRCSSNLVLLWFPSPCFFFQLPRCTQQDVTYFYGSYIIQHNIFIFSNGKAHQQLLVYN